MNAFARASLANIIFPRSELLQRRLRRVESIPPTVLCLQQIAILVLNCYNIQYNNTFINTASWFIFVYYFISLLTHFHSFSSESRLYQISRYLRWRHHMVLSKKKNSLKKPRDWSHLAYILYTHLVHTKQEHEKNRSLEVAPRGHRSVDVFKFTL